MAGTLHLVAESARSTARPGASFSQILDECRAGNEDSFAALWRNMNPRILRYLTILNPASAEDLASETWLEVARSLSRFEGDEAGFRNWLFAIARHRHLDLCRRQARRPALERMAVPDQAGRDDVAGAVIDCESTEAAIALIASLPPDQAEALALRVIGDLNVAEVAAIMGRQPGAVRVLTHRGLRRLADRIPAPDQNGRVTA